MESMKFFKIKLLISFLILSNSVLCKVEPPNYDFSLDQFTQFMPGNKIQDKHKSEITFNKNGFKTYKFYIAHIRYKFPIYIQTKNDVITDFFARLPAYFLHNIFHQSLINRLGSQDIYKKVEEQAIYVWSNKNNLRHYYSGGCSITCFPIFYAVKMNQHKFGSGFIPLMKTFGKN